MKTPQWIHTALTKIEEIMNPNTEKKHIKKLKPATSQPAHFGPGNGGHACPPIGGDVIIGTK
jgi:hypothetical protein